MDQKVLIFVPINIGRNLDNLLGKEINGVDFITPKSPGEELERIEDSLMFPDKAPDVIVSLQPHIIRSMEAIKTGGHFEKICKDDFVLRPEFKDDFGNAGEYIQPLFLAPLILIANGDLENPPLGWRDLADRFTGKVIAPSAETPAAILFKAVMREMGANPFCEKLTCSGLPVDVIMSVNGGLFDVGIIPLPFARYNIAKNAKPVYPREGALVLPQIALVKKDAGSAAKETIDYLFSANIQRFFSQLGGMVPMREGIPIPKEVEKMNVNLYWKGWGWYEKLLQDYAK
jgi:ABC-type Fe3+ transport system substrate-binding protein